MLQTHWLTLGGLTSLPEHWVSECSQSVRNSNRVGLCVTYVALVCRDERDENEQQQKHMDSVCGSKCIVYVVCTQNMYDMIMQYCCRVISPYQWAARARESLDYGMSILAVNRMRLWRWWMAQAVCLINCKLFIVFVMSSTVPPSRCGWFVLIVIEIYSVTGKCSDTESYVMVDLGKIVTISATYTALCITLMTFSEHNWALFARNRDQNRDTDANLIWLNQKWNIMRVKWTNKQHGSIVMCLERNGHTEHPKNHVFPKYGITLTDRLISLWRKD